MQETIEIKGARTHNLKNVSLTLPKNKIIVFTGLSGSGKSSLAFDTIYAEGQRRYVESLSSYARQFLGMMEKPDVDSIEGLSPAISIDQKTTSNNPRSTVGTVTEIYDYLRVLFARIGTPFCPNDGTEIMAKSSDQIVQEILTYPIGEKIQILAPVVRDRKGNHEKLLNYLRQRGFTRVIVDKELFLLEDEIKLDKNKKHTMNVIIDRIVLSGDSDEMRTRIADAVEIAIKEAEGLVTVSHNEKEEIFSSHYSCPNCGFSLPELHPRVFSFNLPEGACEECHGLGMVLKPVPELILDKDESILGNGIRVVNDMEGSKWYHGYFKAMSEKYKFSLSVPIKKLSPEIINLILYGTGTEALDVEIEGKKSSLKIHKPFEGVIPMILRRYEQTESEFARHYYTRFMRQETCSICKGLRLKPALQHILINNRSIGDITSCNISQTHEFITNLDLTESKKIIAEKLLKEIESRINFLLNVGLDYLTLHRKADSLSGGEMQRIRLATQIGTKLTGVLYVLDEPSIGLHQRDNDKLIQTLIHLRDLGNTLIIVEHDEQIIRMADFVVDIGPAAGVYGGEILGAGSLEDILKNKESSTTAYLTGAKKIEIPKQRRKGNGLLIELKGVTTNNLKNLDVKIPLGQMVVVTGVSGSGKSSLIRETLLPALKTELGLKDEDIAYAQYKSIKGIENIDSIISIDQKPIGRTPRSNPATYVGIFNLIRDIFANTNEAKVRGYTAGRFSFNVKGGRCESCAGDGLKKIEMHFLADVYVTCEVCKGKRYNKETLDVFYKGKNIFEVLEMSIAEAYEFFANHSSLKRIFQTLMDVGLNYIKLGQSSTTLSGGEAQRIKLSKELAKRSTGKTVYILDEPTTGLHLADVHKLVDVLNRLTDLGNTVVVIEHNLDLIKVADTIIDIGPEGGERGGKIIGIGTPEEIVKIKDSFTGFYLKEMLK